MSTEYDEALDAAERIDRALHAGDMEFVATELQQWDVEKRSLDASVVVLLGTLCVKELFEDQRERILIALEPLLVKADGAEDAADTIRHLRSERAP